MTQRVIKLEDVFELARQLRAKDRLRLIQRLCAGLERDIIVPKWRSGASASPPDPVVDKDLSELTYAAIGCAMHVHTQLGPGFRENTYQRDLEICFTERGLPFVAQKTLSVYDTLNKGKLIGYYIPDFIIGDPMDLEKQAIVEIKARYDLDKSHFAQIIGYMAVTGCKVGLLINFGRNELQWRRILPPQNIQAHQVNRRWLFRPDWLQDDETK